MQPLYMIPECGTGDGHDKSHTFEVVCALSNGATFDDFKWPRTPVTFKATVQFKGEYLANVSSDSLQDMWF